MRSLAYSWIRAACLVLAAAALTRGARGQGAPFAGTPAPLTLVPSAANVASGATFTVDIHVDLTGVSGSCGASSPPAVLGGYVVPVDFDRTRLQYVSAAACNSPQFSTLPAATAPSTANATGQVSVAASQVSMNAPTGNVCVATLTFQTLPSLGATALTPDPSSSLSSAFQSCAGGGSAGPAAIAAAGSPATVTVTVNPLAPSVPALNPAGLLLLALGLVAAAMLLLQRQR